jgi:hypothetical protein
MEPQCSPKDAEATGVTGVVREYTLLGFIGRGAPTEVWGGRGEGAGKRREKATGLLSWCSSLFIIILFYYLENDSCHYSTCIQ